MQGVRRSTPGVLRDESHHIPGVDPGVDHLPNPDRRIPGAHRVDTTDPPGELGSMQKLGFLPNEAELPHKAHQAESPPRAPERQLDPETNQQLSDQLFRGLLVRMGQREQASALEGVGRLEQLSSAERYHEVEAAHKAFTRLDQEFDRLEQSEPPTDGELQAARSLWMRLGEAYEHWHDMLEKLHELEGNEEKLSSLKVERARDILMYGRLGTRAHLERAFLDESSHFYTTALSSLVFVTHSYHGCTAARVPVLHVAGVLGKSTVSQYKKQKRRAVGPRVA
eukprot:scaffold22146_cov69-Phaeocystis_antarctica.AAC.6